MTTTKGVLPAASLKLPRGGAGVVIPCLLVGAAALGLALLLSSWQEFLRSYLVSFSFFLSISLGALCFVLIQHLTRAGWSVTVRRIAEAMAGNVLVLAILFIPLILGLSSLYEWAHERGDPLIRHKLSWLEPKFFVIRAGIYFGVWILISRFLYRNSVKQDETGDPALTLRMQKWSAPAMVLFGVTVTLASFDLLMSLDPHWFSTIFGVYYFSGGILGFFAFVIPLVYFLKRAGKLEGAVNLEHYHDLGKQLFGYVIFWAYIAFSQYMLIRYANIPEETRWFLLRINGSWAAIGLILVIGHFALPFLALLPRDVKRRPGLLSLLSVWLLVMHWLDLYWITVPSVHTPGPTFGPPDLLCFVGLLGLFLAATFHRLSGASLVPERDPRLGESLAFENI